uniref:(northern house mosquito) hypothetical protein n=1 Tax=Culex pipiens TaxID=7175 RepID=A0A8D8CK74_CULPI
MRVSSCNFLRNRRVKLLLLAAFVTPTPTLSSMFSRLSSVFFSGKSSQLFSREKIIDTLTPLSFLSPDGVAQQVLKHDAIFLLLQIETKITKSSTFFSRIT